MTTRLTFPASMFSVVCQRCGSTVRKNADSCPNCGADRSAAFGQKRVEPTAQARPRANMFEQSASVSTSASASASMAGGTPDGQTGERSNWPAGWDPIRASERIAQKAAEHRATRVEESARNAYADPGYDPDALPGSESWNQRKTIIAGACALVLLIGAVVYLQHGASDDDVTASADHSVSGAIDSKFGPATRSAVSPQGATANADRRSQADARALASGDALQSVRHALDQHDLTVARARLKTVTAQQQTRPDFEPLKDELVRRELQRDAALQLARACERTSAWACVQQNAGEALALDGSNAESQALLERVIEHAGWLVAKPASAAKKPAPTTAAVTPAPAPTPAPANVTVAPPPVATVVIAPKPAVEKRASQRNAAARQAAIDDEAHVDGSYESRADKIARAQAATNAITAATIAPSVAPPVVAAVPRPAPQPETSAKQPAPVTRNATSTGMYVAPANRAASSEGMYVAPNTPGGTAPNHNATGSNGMYDSGASGRGGSSNGMYVAPGGQSSAQPAPAPQTTAMQATTRSIPATATAIPPARPAQATPRTVTTVTTAAATNAAPGFGASTVTAHIDSDKSEEIERAIKQYGWSGGETMPKPSR